jgi:hypothetical protein
VPLQKLSSTDAFVVIDLAGADTADGVVRWAKKVLLDGARTMARSRSYSWALLERRVSGASAGINAVPEDREAAIAAFQEELAPQVAAGALSLDPAKGLSAADLAPLAAQDTRAAVLTSEAPTGSFSDALLAAGIAAGAAAALGGLDGVAVSIEGAGTAGPAIASALADRGARIAAVGTPSGTVVPEPGAPVQDLVAAWVEHSDALPAATGSDLAAGAVLTQDADVLVCGSKLGLVDHELAASLPHRLVVPCGPAPVTARGLAVARRRDAVVLPDFLTLLGPLPAYRADADTATEALLATASETVATLVAEALDHEEGPYLGAAYRAEAFLATWQESLPFGRPLA